VPKNPIANLKKRLELADRAERDTGFQNDLLVACRESKLYWLNMFCWTFHQWDIGATTGNRKPAKIKHVPLISWEVQDRFFDTLDWCLEHGEDILCNKSRDMGASWCCLAYIHWHWLFTPDVQMLEMSRTKEYVDKTGNMKALFQKHDYINRWLPWWMRPPECLPEGKNRSNMHMLNALNGSCIDGESTTEHAASGDRRFIILLDEFAKVKYGKAMRSATRDAGLLRIVNSTVAGPGTEYSVWKNSGQIKVYPLMWWDHPEKGRGRYVERDSLTQAYKIRSPWYNIEESVRSPIEMAQEVDADDIKSGDVFFTPSNITTHAALFGCKSRMTLDIGFANGTSDDSLASHIRMKGTKCLKISRGRAGKLRLWCKLINGRPNQNFSYVFGMDVSKGMGASNSVISIRCLETGEKIAEWADATVPPYEMAKTAVALALWFGGKNLPYLIWEKNGPGLTLGKRLVQEFRYPKYHRTTTIGKVHDQRTDKYGWQNTADAKEQLLTEYDRALLYGDIINHSIESLEEARVYIRFGDGSIGPAELVEENSSARKCHGDRVMADALTMLKKGKQNAKPITHEPPVGSAGHRKMVREQARKGNKAGWRRNFDLR